ncbi:flagellar basal body-associated FliL family protein [Caldimonas thermodepolymerans]|nr:flagellar basal body-associated FliL family protein [Caldimonas thermodepolymerans]UZG47201.1 flagellar basal body-associated FliL family protein [Caldimonas thermodepolymerans]
MKAAHALRHRLEAPKETKNMPAAMAPAAADAAHPNGGKKKKLLIVLAVLALLVAAAVAGLLLLKQRQASAYYDDEIDEVPVQEVARPRTVPGQPPVFLPLEPFTFNLSDKNVERYAQIGITFEMTSPEAAERLKAYLPAVRSNILMLLMHKTADELLDRAGKERLAAEILREAVRPLGMRMPPVDAEFADDDGSGRRRAPRGNAVIKAVHFSNFIIQ